MPSQRFDVMLDDAAVRRLDRLAAKLELPRAAIIRMALRVLAEREGVEHVDTVEGKAAA